MEEVRNEDGWKDKQPDGLVDLLVVWLVARETNKYRYGYRCIYIYIYRYTYIDIAIDSYGYIDIGR